MIHDGACAKNIMKNISKFVTTVTYRNSFGWRYTEIFPLLLFLDPDIPDLDSIQGDSSYGPPHRCYCPQHLDAGAEPGDHECQLLSPAQLRRNASRWGQHHRSSQAPPACPSCIHRLLLLASTALLVAAWWTTRTR